MAISSCLLHKIAKTNLLFTYEFIPSLYSDIVSPEINDSVLVISYYPGAYCGTISAVSNVRVISSINDTIQLFVLCKEPICKVGKKYIIEYSKINTSLPNYGIRISNDSPKLNRKWKIMFGHFK